MVNIIHHTKIVVDQINSELHSKTGYIEARLSVIRAKQRVTCAVMKVKTAEVRRNRLSDLLTYDNKANNNRTSGSKL